MTSKMFFEETSLDVFLTNKKIGIKNNFWVTEQYKEIDEFCQKIRDDISDIIESKNILNKQNLSKLEFSALQFLMEMKNQKFIINDSNKNLGAAAAEKEDVIKECKRQLYDINTYLRLSWEEVEWNC